MSPKILSSSTIEAPALTVGDLRRLVDLVNTLRMADEAEIELSQHRGAHIWVPLTPDGIETELIECGDHYPSQPATYDLLINLHTHE